MNVRVLVLLKSNPRMNKICGVKKYDDDSCLDGDAFEMAKVASCKIGIEIGIGIGIGLGGKYSSHR